MSGNKLIIFTDLDGTLLDANSYVFGPASDAVKLLKELDVPLVVCTSKTKAETIYWRRRLGNIHPFIIENGGAIYIPDAYFGAADQFEKVQDGYAVIALGTAYQTLREALAFLKSEGFDIKGFGDMTPEEVVEITGLNLEDAGLAKEREFDEPFIYRGDKDSLPLLIESIKRLGLNFTVGRLMHIMGDNDKGRAVCRLAGLYRRKYGGVVTAALGDSPNDEPMLKGVDYPFLVRKPEGFHDPGVRDKRVVKVNGVGPEGWAEAVGWLLRKLNLA